MDCIWIAWRKLFELLSIYLFSFCFPNRIKTWEGKVRHCTSCVENAGVLSLNRVPGSELKANVDLLTEVRIKCTVSLVRLTNKIKFEKQPLKIQIKTDLNQDLFWWSFIKDQKSPFSDIKPIKKGINFLICIPLHFYSWEENLAQGFALIALG